MVRHSWMVTLLLLAACSRAQNSGSSSANLTPPQAPRATGFLQAFEELCEREMRQTRGSKMSPAQRLALGDEADSRAQTQSRRRRGEVGEGRERLEHPVGVARKLAVRRVGVA